MWKHVKLFYSRYAIQRRNIFSNGHKTERVVLKATDIVSENSEYALPKETRVVVCGGGVMGAAVAYHLSLLGLGPETILIESGRYIFFFCIHFYYIFLNKITIEEFSLDLYLIFLD